MLVREDVKHEYRQVALACSLGGAKPPAVPDILK